MPKRAAAAALSYSSSSTATTTSSVSSSVSSSSKKKRKSDSPLVLVINLRRREDRLRKLRGVLRGRLSTWERVDAIDGRKLTWDDAAQHLTPKALAQARWAEEKTIPTICGKTGSFSPHFTLGGIACALSHKKAWQRLASSKQHDWALILEDDLACVSVELDGALERCVSSLPSSWQLCMVGYHESSGHLHTPEMRMRVSELGPDESQTGLFGYLLRKSAAVELISCRQIWPLSNQIDVQLGRRHWRAMSRFTVSPDSVLVHSPKSEEGDCDTDVQSLGASDKKAHGSMQKGMLVL